jgi:flagellar biosynthetic protein FliR
MNVLDFGLAGLEGQLWQLLFLSIRCGAALLAAPMIGGSVLPGPVRVLLSVVLAIFIATWLPLPTIPEMMSFAMVLAVVQELLIGAAMGFLLQLAFAIPLIAAEQISGTMGLAIATSIDPSSGAQSGALGTYFSLLLTLLFYAIGGHLLWFEMLVESHRLLPPGSFAFGTINARNIALFMGYGFATAAAIALPVVLVLLLVQVVTGMISRSAPALNLFALGLPAGVLAGICALIIVMPIVVDQLGSVIEAVLAAIANLIEDAETAS